MMKLYPLGYSETHRPQFRLETLRWQEFLLPRLELIIDDIPRTYGNVPCSGDLNSCDMEPIKSAFWRSEAMEARRETSAMTLFPKAIKKLSSVSLLKICRPDVVQAKPAENQREDL